VTILDLDEIRVLAAAVELYTNRLQGDKAALDYLAGRGFGRDLLEREHVGFAVGNELEPYLRWRHLSVAAARRVGLLRADRLEVLASRIVFPEFRQGHPVWLIGRLLDSSDPDRPRYLGLAGTKPLLGWDEANRDLRGVCVVEGPLDLLALRQWGVPGLALCGTGVSLEILSQLQRWERVYTVLDADAAGQKASARLASALGSRVIPIELPPGVKDPADLATRPDGDDLLRTAIRRAVAGGRADVTAQSVRNRATRTRRIHMEDKHLPSIAELDEVDSVCIHAAC
jgi:DNA primase